LALNQHSEAWPRYQECQLATDPNRSANKLMIRKITENKTKGKELDVVCSECNRETWHLVLQSFYDYWQSDDHPEHFVDGGTDYQIIECQGCRTISFRSEGWFSEEDGTSIQLFPKRSSDTLTKKDFYEIPRQLRRIYYEVIESFNNDLLISCAAGLRAIIEGICSEKKIKNGEVEFTDGKGITKIDRKSNLQGKIAGLAEKNILTKSNADILHEHRFLGNEALHELSQPSVTELRLAIEIIEHLLENIYELPSKAKDLKGFKAKRKK